MMGSGVGGGGSSSLVTRHARVFRGRAPTCGWAATARLAIARAAVRMRLHAAAHAGTSTGGAGSRVVSTRTCRTRRPGAGAAGSVRGCAGVPRAAAAAAAGPSSAARATGFSVLACSCAGAGALSSGCARAALALRSCCATHPPAYGGAEPWAVHGDGGSSPSSSLPSCCHCVVIINAKLGLPHFRCSPITVPPPRPRADLPHAACRRGRDGLGPWVCRRPESCGCGGGGS